MPPWPVSAPQRTRLVYSFDLMDILYVLLIFRVPDRPPPVVV